MLPNRERLQALERETDAICNRLQENPLGVYKELQDNRNLHIASGYSPEQFPYPIIAPTLEYLKLYLIDFKFTEPLMQKVFESKINTLIKELQTCLDGVEQYPLDWYVSTYGDTNKSKIVKCPYKRSLQLCSEFVSILETIYCFDIAKKFISELSSKSYHDQILKFPRFNDDYEAVLTSSDSENTIKNMQRMMSTMRDFYHANIDLKEGDNRSDILTLLKENTFPRLEFSNNAGLHGVESSEGLRNVLHEFVRTNLPSFAFFLPIVKGDISLKLFNDIHSVPIYPLGISTNHTLFADDTFMPLFSKYCGNTIIPHHVCNFLRSNEDFSIVIMCAKKFLHFFLNYIRLICYKLF